MPRVSSRALFHASVDDETWRQAGVNGSYVTDYVPNIRGWSF
jgi:hypothetical protein